MPKLTEMKVIVITADQISSRKGGDRVPAALTALDDLKLGTGSRPFVRTAGDEIQGLVTDSAAAVEVIQALTRLGGWRFGVGVGQVESPVPRDVRAANGPAFVSAREALNAAHNAPQDLKVGGGAGDTGEDLEAALWLLVALWRRRTDAGWEAVEAASTGRQYREVAQLLGISASAVSQRLRSSGYAEGAAGVRLAVRLFDRARRGGGVGSDR